MALEPSSSPETIPLSSLLNKQQTSFMSSSSSSTRPLDPLDEPLPPWNLPKLSPAHVYKPDNLLLHTLKLQTIPNVEFAQGTSDITLNSEKTITMPLMSTSLQRSYVNKGFHCVHLGMIQFGIAPRTRRGFNTTALACVLDCSFSNFQVALLTAAQVPVEEGPISFACYPNYYRPIDEHSLNRALKIRVKTSGGEGEGDVGGGVKLSIAWRVCYRPVKGISGPAAQHSTVFDGVFYKHSFDGERTTPGKVVDPTQVQIPKRWVDGQKNLCEKAGSSSGPTV